MLDSFFLKFAYKHRVPAGSSLSVDRLALAEDITNAVKALPNVNFIPEEVKELPPMSDEHIVIIATGPLTSGDFADAITKVTMRKNLFFFDATSPIVHAESIDMSKVYKASRYDKGEADFINLPLDEALYTEFVKALLAAETVELKDFEKKVFFESCLPIEEIARRGEKSLSFGPLKPVGLVDPKTGVIPHAVVQLRQDDQKNQFYQLVGFQTRLKWGEQKRVFRMLPGLENAEFERYGRMHRNSYINAPLIINKFYQSKTMDNLFFSGQISGVEGYVESIASGLSAGMNAARKLCGLPLYNFPDESAVGSLVNYISQADWKDFRPTKFTFGLLPELSKTNRPRHFRKKKFKKEMKAKIALEALDQWLKKVAT